MSALDALRARIESQATRRLLIRHGQENLATLLSKLKARGFGGSTRAPGLDQRLTALRHFWGTLTVDSPREARLVSFSLVDGIGPEGEPLINNQSALAALLDDVRGVGRLRLDVRHFRRCYQGLLSGFFVFDAFERHAGTDGANHWHTLRQYLQQNLQFVVAPTGNPLWVDLLSSNVKIFDAEPCDFLGDELLQQDTRRLTELRLGLNIPGGSWFIRDVVLAQIHSAVRRSDDGFMEVLPQCLRLTSEQGAPVDRGLAALAHRYAGMAVTPVHEPLKRALISRWGNPFLERNELNWRRAGPQAKRMVQQWMTRDCIQEFFELLASDGVGDERRARFWLNYAKSIDSVYFALGATALQSTQPDFVALREKMSGMYSKLTGAGSTNNAFIMTMGNYVVVEFGDSGACYGYDRRNGLPFSTDRELNSVVNSRNSLKHSTNEFKLRHQDNILGYERWESRIEEALADRNIPNGFVEDVLKPQAQQWRVKVSDDRLQGGYLWIYVDNSNTEVNRQLRAWDFEYRTNRGWFRR